MIVLFYLLLLLLYGDSWFYFQSYLIVRDCKTVRDCCVFVFTETWLNNSVPDCAIQLEQLTCYRADRALVEGGKRRGCGLCVYINNVWCRDAVVVCKHCSPLVELMIIKCRCSDTLCNLSEWATHTQCACAVPYYSWKPSIWRPAHKFELPCLCCERVRK